MRTAVNRYHSYDGDTVDAQLQTLIDLQGFDARISGLESEAARLPRQIEAKALRKLRHPSRSKKLRSFLEG